MNTNNLIFLLLIVFGVSDAQVKITDNLTSPTPNSDAVLELESISNNKGLLMPKVSLSDTANPSPLANHVAGITVYNISNVNPALPTGVTPGLYYNDGTSWLKVEAQIPTFGDIKYSNLPADHQGWYLLDGRTLASLPVTPRANATALGLTALPNATDRFLKARASAAETLGALSGNSSVTLVQANLPNTAYSASTISAGSHTHTYSDRASGSLASSESSVTSVIDDGFEVNTTSSAGAHTHTFSIPSGGSGTPLDLEPKYLSTYIFVYLGQ
jgi:hypothetical protein